MTNIIDQMIETINNTPLFFSSYEYENPPLKQTAIEFLKSATYGELEANSYRFMNDVLQIHGKDVFIGLPATALNYIERFDPTIREKHRLHFVHLINVYLLGLFLYHKLREIKTAIINDIISSPNEIAYRNRVLNYSGDSEEGEFHYRWRLAAISHDIGYPIELSINEVNNLLTYIEYLEKVQQDITNFSDFERYNDWDIFNEIDISIPSIDMHNYTSYQMRNPKFKTVFHDHGIYGSLLFLRLMHELFDKEPNIIRETELGDVVFDDNLLHRALKKIAKAIALHSIDRDEGALEQSRVSNEKIYVLHGDSLTWLLKISDELQEWYKWPKNEVPANDEPLTPPNLSITINENDILVKNYPKDPKPLENKMQRYFAPANIIRFSVDT